ncbi:MAG: carboxylating nicotinate-nucleotide diphosphorylase [Bacteroidales bacterium]|jgi:nicotinate-nucleotide pyrophosphorylase (carboxylating)
MDRFNFLFDSIVNLALEEDIAEGDISTNYIVPTNTEATATIKVKAVEGIISGLDVAYNVFKRLDENIDWTPFFKDGDKVKKDDILVEIKGNYAALLTGERTALNFMQRMSGIATKTNAFVKKLEDTNVKILDTRKTVPGLRVLDKIAVKHGGGENHRIGLYDMVMLKDNHIKIAGSITKAVNTVKKNVPLSIKIEVETSTLEEVFEALHAGADIIMLDNMSNDMMSKAVTIVNGKAKTEASGNMTIDRLEEVAKTGVDYISVGELTHSVAALDLSMNFN